MPNSLDGSLIEQGTPLTRNHWFDGKFLRADDLARDQNYHRAALRLANQAGGFGVVRGLEVGLEGAELVLQPGLGMCADGELLLLSSELRVGVDALIAASTAAPSAAPVASGSAGFQPCEAAAADAAAVPAAGGLQIYRLLLSPHQALCGQEDVVGALCERACVTERQRPYRLDGVRLRARRLALNLPELRGFTASSLHLRSRIASNLFALDDAQTPPLPDNGGRLLSPLWCSGTEFSMAGELLLGILVRGGGRADFIDLWAGRRERMASQAEAYWRRRTRMRPLADFLAQVAQFQCQLTGAFRDGLPESGGGECDALRALVAGLQKQLEEATQSEAAVAEVEDGDRLRPQRLGAAASIDWSQAASPRVMKQIGQFVQAAQPLLQGRADRLLLDRGIVELPPAGFLPVAPNGRPLAEQLQDWVGPGVRLQICSAPLDAIGHLFEEAQHSARTSLTRGLADPADKPLLQIIVPDGEGSSAPAPSASAPGFALTLHVDPALMLSTLVRLLGQGAAVPAPGMVAVPAGPAANAPSGPATSTAAPAPALSAGLGLAALAGLGDPDEAEAMAEGVGRVLGDALRFALAAQGRPASVDRAAALHEFEACWSELDCSANPFSAAPGARIELLALLSEADRPGAELPSSARVGLRLRLQANLLLEPDAAREQAARDEIERITGLQGGTLRLGALSGSLQSLRQSLGVPGRTDGEVIERQDALALPLIFLQQLAQPAGLHTVVGLPVGLRGGTLLIVLLEWLPANTGSASPASLRLRLVEQLPQELPPLTHVPPPTPPRFEERRFPLASLRADAQALSPNSAPRRQAEAGLAALETVLGPNAPDAAARERLFGLAAPAPAAASLRARHEWVLFRRPVDARCAAPVVVAPPAITPPPAPPRRTDYQAWVLKAEPHASADHGAAAAISLQSGELPSLRVARLADAGSLRYLGDSASPEQAQAAVLAALATAGLSSPLLGIFTLPASGVSASVERQRFVRLAELALPGTAPPPLQALAALRGLPASNADGQVIFLVDKAPANPPPPSRITRQHRLLLLSERAIRLNNLPFEVLRDVVSSSISANDQLLALQTSGQLPVQLLNFSWPGSAGGTLEAFDNELRTVADAVIQAGGFTSPPRTLTIAQSTADAEALRRCQEEATFLANKLNTVAGVPEAAVRKAAFSLSTFSGSNLMHALTLLFVKG